MQTSVPGGLRFSEGACVTKRLISAGWQNGTLRKMFFGEAIGTYAQSRTPNSEPSTPRPGPGVSMPATALNLRLIMDPALDLGLRGRCLNAYE